MPLGQDPRFLWRQPIDEIRLMRGQKDLPRLASRRVLSEFVHEDLEQPVIEAVLGLLETKEGRWLQDRRADRTGIVYRGSELMEDIVAPPALIARWEVLLAVLA